MFFLGKQRTYFFEKYWLRFYDLKVLSLVANFTYELNFMIKTFFEMVLINTTMGTETNYIIPLLN